MSEPDRRQPIDPADDRWPHEDPDVTRVVPRHTVAGPSEADDDPATGTTAGRASGPAGGFAAQPPDAPTGEPQTTFGADAGLGHGGSVTDQRGDPGSGTADRTDSALDRPAGAGPGDRYPDDSGVGEPTTVVPPYRGTPGPDSGSTPTSYVGAPTVAYPGPSSGGQPTSTGQPWSSGQPAYGGPPSGGYSYQQDAGGTGPGMVTGPTPSGPQFVPAPTTANVVLPPVRMPKAESRVALNALGTVVGLLLVGGGLILLLRYAPGMRDDAGGLDYVHLTLTIVGALLLALAALVTAWASWAAIVPGFLLAGVSVWAMVVDEQYGARYIADGTRWIFQDDRFASFCMTGLGLTVGLLLFFAGLAAVFLRAGVRRTIRRQLDSIQA